MELVSERFYDSFVDGNGAFACRQAYASDEAIASMRTERPSCDQVIDRQEQPPSLHPYAEAAFSDDEVEGEVATVHMTATDGEVGTLEWTDEDADNVWHLNEVRGLEAVNLPERNPKPEATNERPIG